MRGTGARALAQLGGGGGGGGGAAFAFPPWDWAAGSEGFGVGAADFPAPVDLSTLDGGIACTTLETQLAGKVLRARIATGAIDSTMAGASLFTVADEEEGVWLARVIAQHSAAAAADAAPTGGSHSLQYGLALFDGANLAGTYTAAGAYISNGNLSGVAIVGRSNALARTGGSPFATGGAGSVMVADVMDFIIRRTLSQVDIYAGACGQFRRIGTRLHGDGPGVIGVYGATTAGVLDLLVLRARKLAALPAGVPA